MSYYIAEKDEKGEFKLWQKDDEPHVFHSQGEAFDSYRLAVQSKGTSNTKLLQEVALDITTKIKPFELPEP